MPTVVTHTVVPLALRLALGPRLISPQLLVAGMLASMLPDVDVLAFKLGIAYAHAFGHRGVTHSLLFAGIVAMLAALGARFLRTAPWPAALFVGLCTASHGLLDMCTNGGLGIALFWPWSEQRWFFPWHSIQVSPIGVSHVFSSRAWLVWRSEAFWVGLPALFLGGLGCLVRWLGPRIGTREAPEF